MSTLGALPGRCSRLIRRAANHLRKGRQPLVLLYHRIARPAYDPWHLAVSPSNFEAQVRALREVREIVSLTELHARADQPLRGRPLAAITFDDAYTDVFEDGADILSRLDSVATVFVVSGAVASGGEFWWDELARDLLSPPQLPPTLTLQIGEEACEFATDCSARGSAARLALYTSIWARLRDIGQTARERALSQLAEFAVDPVSREALPAGTQTIRAASERGVLAFGAHGTSHRSLPALNDVDLRHELGESRIRIQAITGRNVDTMAYPFGHVDERVVGAARTAGYSIGCTTRCATVEPHSDSLTMPRMTVGDWPAKDFIARLKADPFRP